MTRFRCLLLAALALVVALAACSKQKPTVLPPHSEAPPSAVLTTPPAPTGETALPDPLDGDLDAVNRYVYEQGLLRDIYFDYDLSDLRGDARQQLARNAEFLSRYPQFVVTIEGHCDERGTGEYNLALGDRRASSTRTYLSTLGIEPGRLRPLTYGKDRPTCLDTNESCWSRNRRAHFVITGRNDVRG